jgi:hypothetical protein
VFTLDGVDVWVLSMEDADGTVTIPVRASEDEMSAFIQEIRSHGINDNVRVHFSPAITPLSIVEFRSEFAHMFEDS